MCGCLDPEHDVDNLAAARPVSAERVLVPWANEDKLARLKGLGDAVNPMIGFAAFNQKNLKEVMVMRFRWVAFGKAFAREVERFVGVEISVDMKSYFAHAANIVKEMLHNGN